MIDESWVEQLKIENDPGESAAEVVATSRRTSMPSGPALVKMVADRVYAMMLEDLRIENERRRIAHWRQ